MTQDSKDEDSANVENLMSKASLEDNCAAELKVSDAEVIADVSSSTLPPPAPSPPPAPKSSSSSQEAGNQGAVGASAGPREGMKRVKCACGATLELPVDIYVFRCSQCEQVMQIPRILPEQERELFAKRALQKWIVREAVSRELDSWLDGKETFGSESQSLVARFYRKLIEFPLFKGANVDDALLQLFKFLPTLEDRLKRMSQSRTSIRRRFVNYIAGPVFYATFGDEYTSLLFGDSRGEKNDAFKTEIVNLLKEFEKPDGISTLLESVEASHSLAELPLSFRRMVDSHVQSAVANLEHSLAKPRNRSKLKSLYRLVPRHALLKLIKINVAGTGLISSAINLFMVRPFGRRSLMQRMAATTLGVTDAEDLASMAASNLSPEIKERCLAYVRNYDGEHLIDMWYATDEEIIIFLSDTDLSKRWNCPDIPTEQIHHLCRACEAHQRAELEAAGKGQGSSSRSEMYLGINDDDSASLASSVDELDDLDVESAEDEMSNFDLEIQHDGSVKEAQTPRRSQRRPPPNSFIKKKSQRLTEDAEKHPLQYIRMFCYEEMNRQMGDMAVELLGDPVVDRFVRVVVPAVQKQLIQSVASRGSGLVPLVEGAFDAWKQILRVHSAQKITEAQRRNAYAHVVGGLHELIFTLIHNLVRSDHSNVWHELCYWLVDFYNASRLDLDMDAMIASLPEEQAAVVMEEGEKLRQHEVANASRALGSSSVPPPEIRASHALVEQFRFRIIDGLFNAHSRSQASNGETGGKHLLPKRLRTGESIRIRAEELRLTHLEIIYSYEDASSLPKRGYECLQVDLNISGKSDTKSSLWVRRSLPDHSTTDDGTELEWMKPITSIRIIEGSDPNVENTLRSQGYSKVAKAIDKRGVFLWYSRNENESPIRNMTAIRMDDPNAHLRQQALEQAGYSLLAPIIRSQKTGGFFSSASKAAIGIYLQR